MIWASNTNDPRKCPSHPVPYWHRRLIVIVETILCNIHPPFSLSGAVRTFAYFLASGSYYLLKDVPYLELYGEEASAIEQAFAIFMNVIQLDDEGNVLNAKEADRRAVQYIREYCGKGRAEPPFED